MFSLSPIASDCSQNSTENLCLLQSDCAWDQSVFQCCEKGSGGDTCSLIGVEDQCQRTLNCAWDSNVNRCYNTAGGSCG